MKLLNMNNFLTEDHRAKYDSYLELNNKQINIKLQ